MRVFLTSDSVPGSDIVRRILSLQGHEVEEPVGVGAGALLAAEDWTADAVVAVFFASRPPRQRLGAVLVEVGIAMGSDVPVLAVARPEITLPFLSGIPRIDYDGDDALLAAQLELLLDGVRIGSPGERDVRPVPRGAPSSSKAGPSSGQGLSAKLTNSESFEAEVRNALATTGVELLQEHAWSRGTDRADFTLYFPEHPSLGVVLVEAKSVAGDLEHQDPSRRRRVLRDAAFRLSLQVIASRAGLGVLIYDGSTQRVTPTPLTVTMSLQELATLLEDRPLADVLRRARNEAIHAL